MHGTLRRIWVGLWLLSTAAYALSPEERQFFGLTALEVSHPALNGQGFSYAVSDTEFDLTHPGLGWVSPETFSQWYATTNAMPDLRARNPRIWSAANRSRSEVGYTNQHHGLALYSFNLPVGNNNTLKPDIWGIHGTAVAGTAGSSSIGPEGRSRGVAPAAGMVLASDTEDFGQAAGQVPDGNPFRTVGINRSFTGSSILPEPVRANSGLVTVNAAGNDFGSEYLPKTYVYGISPNIASVRWLTERGYDVIASGLGEVYETTGSSSPWGSMRNQESVWTDFSISTLSPDGLMDMYWSGTSFSAPFALGGLTLVQQAYATTQTNRWLRTDQLLRILRRSAKFVDDPHTGIRMPVLDFAAAVALASTYPGDPGLEPNYTTSFTDTNRVNFVTTEPVYPNPNYFRSDIKYGSGPYDFTAPVISEGTLRHAGKTGPGEATIALRNGWGDLAMIDLSRNGKKLSLSFDFDTNPGWFSGTTETYFGIREMVGSDQFMDAERLTDAASIGRVALRIRAFQGSDQCVVEVLRCSEVPFTNDTLWTRYDAWTPPAWDAPLASLVVTNLTMGLFPRLTVEFTPATIRFLRSGQEILNVIHGAPAFALARSTPYFHFTHSDSDHLTRMRNFTVATTSTQPPSINLIPRRSRVLEGLDASAPAAGGVVSFNRGNVTNVPLTVNYTASGTAANGLDYLTLSGSLVIPANVAETDLQVVPINDATFEPDETVIITLAAGSDYVPGATTTNTFTLVDQSDADGDGVANALEDRNGNGLLANDDTDGDMLPDYLDTDDDGDQVPTALEDRNQNGNPRDDDTDGDGTPDYLDVDDDGDGLTTRQEDRNRNGTPWDDDYDGDGIPDFIDPDPSPYSDYLMMHIGSTFNNWSTSSQPMTLVSNRVWQSTIYLSGVSGLEFKFVANDSWDFNWGDNSQASTVPPVIDAGDPFGGNIVIGGTLSGSYRFTFNDTSFVYRVEFVPPTDRDNDGMADDWELAHQLNPDDPEDASADPDEDGYTNLQEFLAGTDPHVWDPRLTDLASMTVAGSFNGWNTELNNMRLVDDYTWRFIGAFNHASNIQFKFVANGTWTTNWGDNNQSDFLLPLTNGAGESFGANIIISNTLHGLYAFTFNEQTLAYHVSETTDEFSPLLAGVQQIVSPGSPGPVMGAYPWRAIAGGDDDTSTPSAFALARLYGPGRLLTLGHDGIVQHLDLLDNRAFMVNAIKWLNNSGNRQVVYTEGHGEWQRGPQLASLQSEMAALGYTFSSITGRLNAANLDGPKVLIIGNAWQPLDYSEYTEVQSFVNRGGGLLMLGLGWSWPEPNYDIYPMNALGEYFQVRWLRGSIDDPTHQLNGSPLFHTFYPHVPYNDFSAATGRIAAIHAAHAPDLPALLETDAQLRRDYLIAQGALMGVSRDFYLYATDRYDLNDFAIAQVAAYPNLFSKDHVFDPATYPVMSRMRERFLRTALDAQSYLLDYTKDQMAIAALFPAAYSNLLKQYSVYVMDNRSLDATQLTAIASGLGQIPSALHDTRTISVTDFIGATTPPVSLVGRDGQVNIFGLKVGAATENPFPFDVAPRTSDVFNAVVYHELNHVVDRYTMTLGATNHASRRAALIAAAGTNRFHYLRGGHGLEFLGHSFFATYPQEFFASIANQWFTDSEHVFELGFTRFTNGIPHPMNQAIFFADVYSRGQNTTLFYTMSGLGQVTSKPVKLMRNEAGHITVISSDRTTWLFDVDDAGNVVQAVKTDGTQDQDDDGMTDGWEILYDFNPLDPADAGADADRDELTNLQEFSRGTNPRRADTDLDGVIDILDDQPLTPRYGQVSAPTTTIGTATRWSYHLTSYYSSYGYAYWGTPYYSDSKGFASFDISGIPEHAVIRHVAMLYAGQSSDLNYGYPIGPSQTLLVGLGDVDPAPPAEPQMLYDALQTGTVLEAVSGTNTFPFVTWQENTVDWGAGVQANLSSRLGMDRWSIGFRSGSNVYLSATVSNLMLVVSYETNGPYASGYTTMTMASTLNGWNAVANNMVLVSNHMWQFEGDVKRVNGVELKFTANRSWDINWGDNDQFDRVVPLTQLAEAAGGNIVIDGMLDGTLRVTFNALTGAYTIDVLARPDLDQDGLPDEWERLYQVDNPGGNPDGDIYTNLEEFNNGTHPRQWNAPNSLYSAMAVGGTFNSWDTTANMSLVSHFLWQVDLPLDGTTSSIQFKFAANQSWDINWGDHDQTSPGLPITGVADPDAANIWVSVPFDGMMRVVFNESSLDYSVEHIPATDTDGDGMPDYWEDLHGFDHLNPLDADEDADDDGFENVREYRNRTHPRVPNSMSSFYNTMSVAGDFNGWNVGANNMKLVDNYTWQFTVGIDRSSGMEFKFAADGGWDINWGETNQAAPFSVPLEATAEEGGGNILITTALNGTYVFQFNELNRSYVLRQAQTPDFDQDGLPDGWELSNGFDARNAADGAGDYDGDGLSNLDEFRNTTNPRSSDTDGDGYSDFNEVIAGTSPLNPQSLLEVGTTVSGNTVRVTWPAVATRTYNVMYRNTLLSGDWLPLPNGSNLVGQAGTMQMDFSASGEEPVFLRVNVHKTNVP